MNNLSPTRRRGFTLLELLVALSLFGIALLMIYSGLFSAARSWESGERQISRNEIQRLQLGFLQRLLRETVPLTLYDGRENSILFHGDEQRLRFIAPLPSHRGGDWAYLITLQSGSGNGDGNLLLYYEPLSADLNIEDDPPEDAGDVIIAENIENLTFRYYGDPGDRGRSDWHETWESPDKLPALIRLELTLADRESFLIPVIARINNNPVRGQLQQVLYAANLERGTGRGQDEIPRNEE